MYFIVRKINYINKKKLVGQVLKAIGVAVKANNTLIAYTLPHGPVINVITKSPRVFIGKMIEVTVTRVISDRVIGGQVRAILN